MTPNEAIERGFIGPKILPGVTLEAVSFTGRYLWAFFF